MGDRARDLRGVDDAGPAPGGRRGDVPGVSGVEAEVRALSGPRLQPSRRRPGRSAGAGRGGGGAVAAVRRHRRGDAPVPHHGRPRLFGGEPVVLWLRSGGGGQGASGEAPVTGAGDAPLEWAARERQAARKGPRRRVLAWVGLNPAARRADALTARVTHGAVGEQWTAQVLTRLPDGWTVFHGRKLPGF